MEISSDRLKLYGAGYTSRHLAAPVYGVGPSTRIFRNFKKTSPITSVTEDTLAASCHQFHGCTPAAMQFIEKLCALVPTPRAHSVRYHGILGPAAKWRERIVPNNVTTAAALESGNVSASCPASSGADPSEHSQQENASPAAERHPRNYLRSELLMKRVFAADILTCDCGGMLRILATIRPPETTRKILDHLGLPSRPPPLAPAVLQALPFAFE